MTRNCPICDDPFKHDDHIVAVMLSVYKEIDSDIHYAITTPTECLEIIHRECYDFPPSDEGHFHAGGING